MSDQNTPSEFTNPEQKHSYDGLIEENHPMPGWWVWSFILCVVFGVIYYIHYEIAGGPTLKQELALAMQDYEKTKQKTASQFPNLNESEILEKYSAASSTQLAQETLKNRCTVCHGEQLEGKIGPSLLDAEWKNASGSGSAPDIVKVLRSGVAEKGMPPWEGVISKDEIFALAAYIVANKKNK